MYNQEDVEEIFNEMLDSMNTSNQWVSFELDGVTMNVYKKQDVVSTTDLKPFARFKLLEVNGEKVIG